VPDRIAQRLRLGGEYSDAATHEKQVYEVTKSSQTLTSSYFAGIVSGLLGVGGGIIKVPTMNLLSKVPVKVASATSNFMIGVTAAASASIYFARGQVDPLIVAPLMIGVVLGATIGTRLLRKTPPLKVKVMFGILLAIVAVLMILRAVNVPIVV
jgi:uncharacterized membrane protein YfcA